jgi:hypothetical protein
MPNVNVRNGSIEIAFARDMTLGIAFFHLFPAVVPEWKVEGGVSQAQEVATATKKNGNKEKWLAAHGGRDFINERFNDMTIALIDDKGSARAEQKIHGTFHEPVVDKPNILQTLGGPAWSC